ncbi:Esterase EstB [Shimia sp. SK013]|uniref:serine hydrolase domain-containing protein n=1 Tax=Shimia sp. SK013 TaxID=1389006 RepID=UPI0006CDCB53|nr:serine hydrolase domain-containing protein [Shimia sp. SK013]KPA21231.1 Esterase EstB [Shimia sp. SK013]
MIGTADPRDRGFDSKRLEVIRDWMQSLVTDRKHAGNGLLIARGGDVVFDHVAGLRSVENATTFDRDTVARIYSMTKPVTTVALMMLAEKGLFHLDAPVSEFVPEFADCRALIKGATSIDQTEPCATPTLHQLATHTSGLSYPFNPGVLAAEMDEQDVLFKPNQGALADEVRRLAALPLAFNPGARWEYSVGIDVLGRVIEAVSGKPLDVFFQDEIFGPLGMTETGFSVQPSQSDRFAALYTPLAGNAMGLNDAEMGAETLRLVDRPDESPFLNASTFSGGGGLVGTMDDYLRFAEMLRRGGALGDARLLSPRTTNFMMSNHLRGDIASMGPESFAEQPMEGMGFGLGGAVVLDAGRARVPGSVGDFSWGGMASTFFWVDPVEDLSVVFFTQLSPSSSYPTRPQLKALVHGALTN